MPNGANNPVSDDKDDNDKAKPGRLKRVEGHIQRKTIDGLLDLTPLLVTLVVVIFLVERADALIRPLPFIAGRPWDFPGLGLIVGVLLLYVVGLAVSTRIGKALSDGKNLVMSRIPVVRAIFGSTQQLLTSFTAQYTFSRVVFLEWPREGMIAMGFVTGRAYSDKTNESMVIVYIPTIPNPTSGNMALVIEDDVIETDLAVDEAMKLVFSGGIILPEALSFARVPRDKPEDLELIGRFETEPTHSEPVDASEQDGKT